MKIKKLGRCCLVIEISGKKIMTDPGSYTTEEQAKERKIDLILITHEHGDHFHLESLKKVLANNPKAIIITNSGVGKFLMESGIKYEVLENRISKEICGIELEAYDCKHEEIFKEIGQVQNTGYFINQRLFYPGDSFYNPGRPVEILALPVAGPWTKVKDFMHYVLAVKPRVCFPVHDGMLTSFTNTAYFIPKMVLPTFGIVFKTFEKDGEEEF